MLMVTNFVVQYIKRHIRSLTLTSLLLAGCVNLTAGNLLAITVRKTVIYISLLRQANTNKLRSYCPIMSPVKC